MTFYKMTARLSVGLFALALYQVSWAEGCVQDPADDFTDFEFALTVDGTSECASAVGQFGCRIDNGVGWCSTEFDGETLTVVSFFGSDLGGGVKWKLVTPENITDSDIAAVLPAGTPPSTVSAELGILGGASGGNACAYTAVTGKGGGSFAFEKSNGGYSNVTFLDVCTDGDTAVPQTTADLPECEAADGTPFTLSCGLEANCPADPEVSYVVTCPQYTNEEGLSVDGFGYQNSDGSFNVNNSCSCGDTTFGNCDPSLPPEELKACQTEAQTSEGIIINIQNPGCWYVNGRSYCGSY